MANGDTGSPSRLSGAGIPRAITKIAVVSVDRLTEALRREGRSLDALLFRLIELRDLLVAQETRFLSWAAADVERAAEGVRERELRRAAAAEAAAGHLGAHLDPPTLTAIAGVAPAPYDSLLVEQQVALRRVLEEVATVAAEATTAAQIGIAQVESEQDVLASHAVVLAEGEPDAIDPTGIELDLEMAAVAYGAALTAAAWFPPPALQAFVE